MCRSIKTLRQLEQPISEQEIQEAALQYVRKISGYRRPSKANQETFDQAVLQVAEATRLLIANLKTRQSDVAETSLELSLPRVMRRAD
jgi:hypothetical protein